MLGPVAGRVHDPDRDVADLDLVSVGERLERVFWLARRMGGNARSELEREAPVPRDVVGVRVRLEHLLDPDAAPGRLLEVGLDRVGRVDDDRAGRVLVADEVRGTAEPLVHELPEEHELGR